VNSIVSVVIPARDAERFLGDALSSVLSQTLEALDVIVVEDGSRDRTKEVALEVSDPRLRLLEGPGGMTGARLAGMKAARGEFIAFLDSDDYWFPEKLASQVSILREDPSVAAVGCFMQMEATDGFAIGVAGQKVGAEEQRLVQAGALMPFPSSSLVLRRALIRGVEPLVSDLVLVADLAVLAHAARQGGVVCVPRILGARRFHGESATDRAFFQVREETRYLQAKLSALSLGEPLTREEFFASHSPSRATKRGDKSAYYYHLAGLRMTRRQSVPALLHLALAFSYSPSYVVRRFRVHRRDMRSLG
jgi:glycosyltransferase involved in cell wall biosynthesis